MQLQQTTRNTVLVVEDDVSSQRLMDVALDRIGHRATIAGSGEEALEKVHSHAYSLIFMDCLLPGVNGYDTTRRIRQWSTCNQQIPIIGMTAYPLYESRTKCLASGMNDCLNKPIRFDQVQSLLSQYLVPAS